MGRGSGDMGRLAGAEPGNVNGVGVATSLAPGCTGVDLTLTGAASVGGALDVAGALELAGAYKHAPNKLWVPAKIGDTGDGSATLTAGQVWHMLLPLEAGKRLLYVRWSFDAINTLSKGLAIRKIAAWTGVVSTVDSTTSILSGNQVVTQTVSPAATIGDEEVYLLRFTAAANGDVLFGAGLEFDRP